MDSSDRGQLRWGTAQTWDGSDRGTVQTWDSSGGEHLRQGTTWGGGTTAQAGEQLPLKENAVSGPKCCFGSRRHQGCSLGLIPGTFQPQSRDISFLC